MQTINSGVEALGPLGRSSGESMWWSSKLIIRTLYSHNLLNAENVYYIITARTDVRFPISFFLTFTGKYAPKVLTLWGDYNM